MNGLQYYSDLGISLDNTSVSSLVDNLKSGTTLFNLIPGLSSVTDLLTKAIAIKNQVISARDKADNAISDMLGYVDKTESTLNKAVKALNVQQQVASITKSVDTVTFVPAYANAAVAQQPEAMAAAVATYTTEETTVNTTITAATMVVTEIIDFLENTIKPNLKKAQNELQTVNTYIEKMEKQLDNFKDVILERMQFSTVFVGKTSPTSVDVVIPEDIQQQLDENDVDAYSSITNLSNDIQGKVKTIMQLAGGSIPSFDNVEDMAESAKTQAQQAVEATTAQLTEQASESQP